jgi:hypothetical protein
VIEDHVHTHLVDAEKHPGALNTEAAEQLLEGVRLTNHMVGGVWLPALGLMVGYFRANHAAGPRG